MVLFFNELMLPRSIVAVGLIEGSDAAGADWIETTLRCQFDFHVDDGRG